MTILQYFVRFSNHFKGYPSELLPVTVAGIPSMHICLDFIPELLSQPSMDKQVKQHRYLLRFTQQQHVIGEKMCVQCNSIQSVRFISRSLRLNWCHT